MTREIPHATRLLGLVPVAALFAALGVTRLLAPLSSVWRRSAMRIAVGGLVLAAIGLNSYQYFVIEANDPSADEMLDLTGRTLCEYLRQLNGVDVYWTADIGFWAGGQCQFLARGRYTDFELTLERARNPASLRHERPVIAVIGREFLDDHRAEISRAADGSPRLDFPSEPLVQRDRQGRCCTICTASERDTGWPSCYFAKSSHGGRNCGMRMAECGFRHPHCVIRNGLRASAGGALSAWSRRWRWCS